MLKKALLELLIVEASFSHVTQIEVVDAQVLISNQFSVKIRIVPSELQKLLEAESRFGIVFEAPVNVAQLFVCDHFVFELQVILAFVFNSREYFAGHLEIFEVHCDLAKCFQGPVKAEKCLFLVLFYKVAQGLQNREHCVALHLTGLDRITDQARPFNDRIFLIFKMAHQGDYLGPLLKVAGLELPNFTVHHMAQMSQEGFYSLLIRHQVCWDAKHVRYAQQGGSTLVHKSFIEDRCEIRLFFLLILLKVVPPMIVKFDDLSLNFLACSILFNTPRG